MLDRLLSLIAPHYCLTCEAEGSLLCYGCAEALSQLPERCYRCHALSPGGKTCSKCRKRTTLSHVSAAVRYEGVAKDLVWKLKFAHAPAAASTIAQIMCRRVVFDPTALLIYAPTATSRVRQRGFDQAQLVARAVSRLTGVPCHTGLVRLGQARQVGANRKERAEHLATAFRVTRPSRIVGKHIVLIDDVLTTGATLEAAAATLKRAGARRVDAIVFAQA